MQKAEKKEQRETKAVRRRTDAPVDVVRESREPREVSEVNGANGHDVEAKPGEAEVTEAFNEIIIVDDQRDTHSAVRLAFSGPQKRVHAARSTQDAVRFLGHRKVDLVVSQLRGQDVDGLELIRWIRERDPKVPIVVAGDNASREDVIQALNLGANYYLERPVDNTKLTQALADISKRAVAPEGNVPRRSQLASGGPGDPLRSLPLSEREKEISLKVSEGLNNREIANALGISAQTVRNHLSKIYRKLLINSRSQLARLILTLE